MTDPGLTVCTFAFASWVFQGLRRSILFCSLSETRLLVMQSVLECRGWMGGYILTTLEPLHIREPAPGA